MVKIAIKNPYLFNHQIAKFKYPANVTHKRYGKFRYAAVFEMASKCRIITTINIHKSTSQMKENKYHWKLKKKMDHKKFTIN